MNMKNVPFRKLGPFDVARPWLPVTVVNPHANIKLPVLGLIDTGADECAFPAQLASVLGHNLQNGFKLDRFSSQSSCPFAWGTKFLK
jgi:hypothetical protein